MSASGTPQLDPSIILPILKEYLGQMQHTMKLLLLHTVFGTLLIPLMIALIYFSSSKQRQAPMFWFVLFDLFLGMGVASWHMSVWFDLIFKTLGQIEPATAIALTLVQGLTTWIVDFTILFRLYAVFPISSTNKAKFIAIFSFPLAIKAARLALIIYIGKWVSNRTASVLANPASSSTDISGLINGPEIRIEACCALADHIYVSTLFLYKLRSSLSRSRNASRKRSNQGVSLVDRMRTLFYIALGNLVFPVIFNILVIAILFARPSLLVTFFIPTNVYVTIVGVVFATVWNSSANVHDERKFQLASSTTELSSSRFQRELASTARAKDDELRYIDSMHHYPQVNTLSSRVDDEHDVKYYAE